MSVYWRIWQRMKLNGSGFRAMDYPDRAIFLVFLSTNVGNLLLGLRLELELGELNIIRTDNCWSVFSRFHSTLEFVIGVRGVWEFFIEPEQLLSAFGADQQVKLSIWRKVAAPLVSHGLLSEG